MMGPYKGARESRQQYTRASVALAPRLTEDEARLLGRAVVVEAAGSIGRGIGWLLWLPVRIVLVIFVLSMCMQGAVAVEAAPVGDGVPWYVYAAIVAGLWWSILCIRRAFWR